MLDFMKKYYQIKRNLIIQHNFLQDYNRYKAEIFRVNITFDDLTNDVSHFVLA